MHIRDGKSTKQQESKLEPYMYSKIDTGILEVRMPTQINK